MPKMKTQEQFEQEVFDKYGDEYTVLGPYLGNKKKVLMRHNTCGTEWEVGAGNFLINSTRCPNCYGTKKSTTQEFKDEVKRLTDGEYEVVDGEEYISTHTHILMRHIKCGTIYKVKPNIFRQGHRCAVCSAEIVAKKLSHNTQIFKDKLFKLVGNEYELVDGEEYTNINHKLKIRHNKCGKEYHVHPNHILNNGRRCPFCRRSVAEEKIANFLDKYNIPYEVQKTFNECKSKKNRALRFDFYVPNYMLDGKLYNLALEFNGIQHYEKVNYITQEQFEIQQENDNIKKEFLNQYGEVYNLAYLELDYTHFKTLDSILKDTFLLR